MKVKNMFYDKDFRNKVRNLDKETLAQLVGNSMDVADIVVLTNTKSTTYFMIPVDGSGIDKQLQFIQAAGSEELSTIGTSSSVGTVTTCVSSAGTLSTAGSVETQV